MWLFCIFLCFLIISLYHLWKNVYRKHFYYWPQYQSLAKVPGIIFVNNFWSFVTFKTNFAYYMKTIYDDPKYASAPVVGVCGFITPGLLIREPEIVKSMLVKDFDCFCDRFSEPNAHHDPIGSLNMFFARYAIWKDIRRKLSPIFTSGKLKYMYPLIQNIGNNMDNYLKKQPSVFISDVKELCIRFTTDVIATTIFGIDSNFPKIMDKIIYFEKNYLSSLENVIWFCSGSVWGSQIKYWPNPSKFDPERFSDDNKSTINPMAYLPFGNGPHNCIASRLGLLQVNTGLISILKNHIVRICDKTDIKPEFDAKSVTLQVKGGVYLELVRDDMCDKVLSKL